MSHSAEAANGHGHHYTTTGLDNRKIAIWAFIGSECMLFASLISTYLIYKGKSIVGPFPHHAWTDPSSGKVFPAILNIPVTSASTFVLLMSSLAMVLALAAKLRLVRARQLLSFWRYAVIVIFVIAAVVTPTPDPLTQSMVAGPLLLLYFLGVLFAWALQPKRKTEETGS